HISGLDIALTQTAENYKSEKPLISEKENSELLRGENHSNSEFDKLYAESHSNGIEPVCGILKRGINKYCAESHSCGLKIIAEKS
ncbi:hypothetical protein, partial [Neotamlana nanhaiensis]|uniref:hypothetical protein n=1 Tax=Neotamlana nanhaiensis TaxID=1382798 RepID=UPI000AAB9905